MSTHTGLNPPMLGRGLLSSLADYWCCCFCAASRLLLSAFWRSFGQA